MTIHPFPKSLRGSLGQRGWLISSRELAGVVHAVAPLGHAEAIPALFFQSTCDCDQDVRRGGIVMADVRSDVEKRRDFISRTEQVLAAAILADEAASDLLDRCVQLRNSLCDAHNYEDITWKLLRKPTPEKSATNRAGGI